MSWQDRDKLDLKITTGDGRVYTVSWLTASQKIRWHGASHSYIDVDDTMVRKRKREGRIIPLEFYFTGDLHLEQAEAFRFSLDHPNPCTIEHPYYNTIIAQILELDIDNGSLNVSRCTCTALETMVAEPASISDKIDIVLLKKVELDDLIQEQGELTNLTITEINTAKETTAKVNKLGAAIVRVQQEAQAYQNAYQNTATAINAITSVPLEAMVTLNSFLTLPAKFTASVLDRIRVLKEQFDILRGTINGLFNPQGKRLFSLQEASILSTLCQAAVLPQEGDYRNASIALRVAQTIHEAYKVYQEDMDALQTDNNGSPLSFVPDHDIELKLEDTILSTVSGLYAIALSGRRERTFQLTEDSNVILLTHMLYRLDPADENMEELIETNGLTWDQIALGIKKGTTITYYV